MTEGTHQPLTAMRWLPVLDGDDRARALYLRHYSAKKNRPWWKRSRQFIAPGEKMLLLLRDCRAVFGWVRNVVERYDKQDGVCCVVFRNESPELSSSLIEEACELAWNKWPGERLFTYVDPKEVRSTNPGYCFIKAGFRKAGRSKKGLILLERRATFGRTEETG